MNAKFWLQRSIVCFSVGGFLLNIAGCPPLGAEDAASNLAASPAPAPPSGDNAARSAPSDSNPGTPAQSNPNPPPSDNPVPGPRQAVDPSPTNPLPTNLPPADPPPAQDPPVSNPPPDVGTAFVPTYAVSSGVVQNASFYLELGVNAAIRASVLANGGTQLVTTGTLTQTAPNTLDFTYAPEPADRLRVVLTDGRAAEFFITTLTGNFSNDGRTFLNNPHEARLRVRDGEQMDLEFFSQQAQGNRQAAAKGSFVHNGTRYTADLQAAGNYYFETDTTGSHFETRSLYTGTVAADGFVMQVNETWEYVSVYASGAAEASSLRRTLNNTWTTAAGRYRWNDAVVKAVFRDGKPNNLDTEWFVGGQLLKDDAPRGRLERGGDAINVKVELVLPNERVELQAWRR